MRDFQIQLAPETCYHIKDLVLYIFLGAGFNKKIILKALLFLLKTQATGIGERALPFSCAPSPPFFAWLAFFETNLLASLELVRF